MRKRSAATRKRLRFFRRSTASPDRATISTCARLAHHSGVSPCSPTRLRPGSVGRGRRGPLARRRRGRHLRQAFNLDELLPMSAAGRPASAQRSTRGIPSAVSVPAAPQAGSAVAAVAAGYCPGGSGTTPRLHPAWRAGAGLYGIRSTRGSDISASTPELQARYCGGNGPFRPGHRPSAPDPRRSSPARPDIRASAPIRYLQQPAFSRSVRAKGLRKSSRPGVSVRAAGKSSGTRRPVLLLLASPA